MGRELNSLCVILCFRGYWLGRGLLFQTCTGVSHFKQVFKTLGLVDKGKETALRMCLFDASLLLFISAGLAQWPFTVGGSLLFEMLCLFLLKRHPHCLVV